MVEKRKGGGGGFSCWWFVSCYLWTFLRSVPTNRERKLNIKDSQRQILFGCAVIAASCVVTVVSNVGVLKSRSAPSQSKIGLPDHHDGGDNRNCREEHAVQDQAFMLSERSLPLGVKRCLPLASTQQLRALSRGKHDFQSKFTISLANAAWIHTSRFLFDIDFDLHLDVLNIPAST